MKGWRAWVAGAAAWAAAGWATAGEPLAARTNYWAFQPLLRASPPAVAHGSRVRNPIDQFLLARLETEGIEPSPEADRRTLIRRLAFDLTGLPPAPEEVRAFLEDRRSDAYERLVDRLLASPRFGERWARHWLDVVHFGESHGYDKDKPRPNAWPYRDYVIRSFNEDKPYPRFVQEQVAGDALYPDEPQATAALGFIAAGPWDFVGHVELPESKTDGLIARYNDRDDMVTTVMSTFLSLTVHCARCHDHKFDPIPSKEYYGLQAVFAGVDRADRPFDADPAVQRRRRELTAKKHEFEARRKSLAEAAASVHSPELGAAVTALGRAKARAKAALAQEESPSNGYHSAIASDAGAVKWVQVDLGDSVAIQEVRLVPARPTDFPDTPGFGFPRRFKVEASDEPGFAAGRLLADHTAEDYPNPGGRTFTADGTGVRARYLRVTATRLWERTSDFVFALGELEVVSAGGNAASGAAVTALDSIEAGRWSRAALVDGYDSRCRLGGAAGEDKAAVEAELKAAEAHERQLRHALLPPAWHEADAGVTAGLSQVEKELAALPAPHWVYAAASAFASSGNFSPAATPRPVRVLARGDVRSGGPLAAPGALSSLPGMSGDFSVAPDAPESARRAALAGWLTAPQNGLLRRSIVNRVWQEHFGRGLVDTPNDFGHMGAKPSHPELLDWLARWFSDHGESLKALHRLIVTSAAYRQSSAPRPEAERRDADNRLVWRMSRSRLDAEALHDALLTLGGRRDDRMGGPSDRQFWFKDDHSPIYDYGRFDPEAPEGRRRSVYRFIVRSVPDPFMETMDCPDPSVLAGRRSVTVTPLQALALLNDAFVLGEAGHFAERVRSGSADLPGAVAQAFELALARPPTPGEQAAFTDYARRRGLANACRVIINSNEFVFVD